MKVSYSLFIRGVVAAEGEACSCTSGVFKQGYSCHYSKVGGVGKGTTAAYSLNRSLKRFEDYRLVGGRFSDSLLGSLKI